MVKQWNELGWFRRQHSANRFPKRIVQRVLWLDDYLGHETSLPAIIWPLYFMTWCAGMTGIAIANIWRLARLVAKDELVDFCLVSGVSHAYFSAFEIPMLIARIPMTPRILYAIVWEKLLNISRSQVVCSFGQSGEVICPLKWRLDSGMMSTLWLDFIVLFFR